MNQTPKSKEQRFFDHRNQGLSFIQQALKLDESKKSDKTDDEKKELIKLYQKGLREFEAGLRIDTRHNWPAPIEKLQREMTTNIQKIKERISDLTPLSSNLKPPSPNRGDTNSKKLKSKPTTYPSAKHKSPLTTTTPGGPKQKIRNVEGVDSKLLELISSEILTKTTDQTNFETVIGHGSAKQALREMVILPRIRKDLFKGLRQPCRGLLLFGPPGNGKTLLAKAVAAESAMTFFNISASSLTSKWVGEGEKLVRALFTVARKSQPCIIFVDEIDSFLCKRKETEHEASRKLKTEFFLQFDGVKSNKDDEITIIGATNRPQELDEAIIRRLPKRIYIQLPDEKARLDLLIMLLKTQEHSVSKAELYKLAQLTDGYSCCDVEALAREAAMIAVRELSSGQLATVKTLRKLNFNDLMLAYRSVRKSIAPESLILYQEWNNKYGDMSQIF